MTLRTRLLLAQLPLALALVLVGVLAATTLRLLGQSGQRILEDNYRSVLAAQRMKETLERMDSASLFLGIGERERAEAQVATYRPLFEQELAVQEGNITEPGEAEATALLRQRYQAYAAGLEGYFRLQGQLALRQRYQEQVQPAFLATKEAADAILALNQDAMVAKSEAQRRTSERIDSVTLWGVLAALVLGLLASSSLTRRALLPLGVLSQAVRRLGEGDLSARAQVRTGGEVGQLARDFNTMAEGLQAYRQSSLGELLQAQASSQAAIDSLPDPVVVFGPEGGLHNVNGAAERLLGVSVEKGAESLAHLPPQLREVLDRVRAYVLSGKGAYSPRGYEEALRVESPEGPLFLLPRASPVYAESGGIVGVTCLLQDVTRLKRFDELKNDLVATVAHEFRTPLTSLRMAIHLCVEEVVGPLTHKQADLLFAAREDCERLQRIVEDLLDLSRIQEGRLHLHLRPVSAEGLVDEVLSTQRVAAEDKRLTLEARVEPQLTVWADADRLALALGNLVSNAVRYTPEGGRVEVSLWRRDGGARAEVRDSGPGIPPEDRARIFERFYQVPGRTGGAGGLGLSITRDIVRAHGGDIGVEGPEGGGSLFWFTLPQPPSER